MGLLRVLPGQTATGCVLPLPAPGVMLDNQHRQRRAIYLNSPVTFAYQVRNRGTVALTGVNVTDSACALPGGTLTQTGNGNGDAPFDASEIWSYTCGHAGRHHHQPHDGHGARRRRCHSHGCGHGRRLRRQPADRAGARRRPRRCRPASPSPSPMPSPCRGGVGSLSNVVVTDDACTPPPHRRRHQCNNILEVGETWLYACTVTLNANVQSTATATAVDPSAPGGGAVVPLAIEVLPASIQLSVQPVVTSRHRLAPRSTTTTP